MLVNCPFCENKIVVWMHNEDVKFFPHVILYEIRCTCDLFCNADSVERLWKQENTIVCSSYSLEEAIKRWNKWAVKTKSYLKKKEVEDKMVIRGNKMSEQEGKMAVQEKVRKTVGIKVVYAIPSEMTAHEQAELEEKINTAMITIGAKWYAQGVELATMERDIAFDVPYGS